MAARHELAFAKASEHSLRRLLDSALDDLDGLRAKGRLLQMDNRADWSKHAEGKPWPGDWQGLRSALFGENVSVLHVRNLCGSTDRYW